MLSAFSAAESKVLAYILQKTQPTKNEFIGACKTIARKLNCDVTTVRSTFKKMAEKDMLAKTDNERIWMLNPRLLVKGDIIVQARLMSKYDTLLKRPLSNLIITDDEGNDPVFLPIEYPTPESLGNVKSDFFRVFDSFFETVSGLGGKESEVLYFLVCAMQASNNTYIGPMKEIAVNVNCSKATVQRAMLHGSVDFAVQVNRHGQRLIKFVQRGQQLQTLPGAAVTVTIAIGRDDSQSVNQVPAG